VEALAELHRQWETHVAEADDTDLEVAEVESRHRGWGIGDRGRLQILRVPHPDAHN
jgi:hypothetical protein